MLSPTPTAAEYRQYADECLAWAKSAKTDHERDIFLQMAKTWTEAALLAKKAKPASASRSKSRGNQEDNAAA
jgi:hypothetical protein